MKKKRDGFVNSDKHSFNGTKLFPWTPNRSIAAQSMGMLYPDIGSEGFEQIKRTKVYAGAVKDVIICLWILTQDENQVDEADASPVEAYRLARKWACKLGIHNRKADKFWEAYAKFSDVMNEWQDAVTTPKIEGNDDDDSGND